MLPTRIRYVKTQENKLRTKNDIIITDLFYSAIIDPVNLTWEIETPDGQLTGKASSLHYCKKKVKDTLEGFGARFRNEKRAKRK